MVSRRVLTKIASFLFLVTFLAGGPVSVEEGI